MLFSSFEFYIFIFAVFLCWLTSASQYRWVVLLISSYIFYFNCNPWFCLILLLCTLATWFAGRGIADAIGDKKKKKLLCLGIGINLTPLLFFKYYNFFNDSLSDVFHLFGYIYNIPGLSIFLPIGISFYSFTAISYCVDVYNEKIKHENNIGIFALYLAFFPKLISGPIERSWYFLPQLNRKIAFDSQLFFSGVQLFFWGVFKKVVIADRLAMYVDMVFNYPQDYWGKTAILAAWLFSLQIYCDFSAYTDMAIGCGRIFGIEMSRNFNFPYMARSIPDFWQRWHITLTSWFRDYVYIPLGGNRITAGRWSINIMVVFLLSGLWHGAAWTFLWWGGLHGMYYLFGKVSFQVRNRLRELFGIRGRLAAALQVIITFNLVSLAWVFFRAATIEDAFCLIKQMFSGLSIPVRVMASQFSTALTFGFAIVFVMTELFLFWDSKNDHQFTRAIPNYFKYPLYVTVLLAISLLGVSSNQFIYFHF